MITRTLCELLDRTGGAMLGLAGLLMAAGVMIAWSVIREEFAHKCDCCADLTDHERDWIREFARWTLVLFVCGMAAVLPLSYAYLLGGMD